MLVPSTFLFLLSSVISATIAAPVAQAPDAVSVSATDALSSSSVAAPSATSADPANLDPSPSPSAPGIEFGAESVPLSSVEAPLPVPSSAAPAPTPSKMILKPVHHPAPPVKHLPPPIHHITTTSEHVPIYTLPVHHIPPPVHHTTSTFHHVPVYTPIVHEPPVHHTTPVHVPIYTPPAHHVLPPVHHTTTLEHVPVHVPTPIHHIPPPVHTPPAHVPVHVPVHHSFDKWDGHESLKGFDDFYGVDNWDGYKFEQVFVKQEHELVCRKQEIHIIQQRLLVLQEMAKKIVTETICEVEVQTIVFEQFYAGLHGFGRDIRRNPGKHHQVGYDEEIVKHFPKIIKVDGSLDVEDWKFTGKDLGKHTVLVKGHNWNDKTSFPSVWRAWAAARQGWYDLYGQWF
jgi:hypothetical protein